MRGGGGVKTGGRGQERRQMMLTFGRQRWVKPNRRDSEGFWDSAAARATLHSAVPSASSSARVARE